VVMHIKGATGLELSIGQGTVLRILQRFAASVRRLGLLMRASIEALNESGFFKPSFCLLLGSGAWCTERSHPIHARRNRHMMKPYALPFIAGLRLRSIGWTGVC
jgi:hypothetical protein